MGRLSSTVLQRVEPFLAPRRLIPPFASSGYHPLLVPRSPRSGLSLGHCRQHLDRRCSRAMQKCHPSRGLLLSELCLGGQNGQPQLAIIGPDGLCTFAQLEVRALLTERVAHLSR
jgi:hypothetical protein